MALTLPSEADIAREIGHDVDPDAIFRERTGLRGIAGRVLASGLWNTYLRMSGEDPYSPDAASAGRRALRNTCLDLLVATGDATARALAMRHFEVADNMTDRLAALAALSLQQTTEREQALEAFYQQFQSDALVIDKWLILQAAIPEARHARPGARAHHPQGILICQPQPRALADRRLRARQSNAVQPRRWRRLRVRGRLRAQPRSEEPASRRAPDDRVPQLACARADAARARRSVAASRRRQVGALSRDVRDIVERSLAG